MAGKTPRHGVSLDVRLDNDAIIQILSCQPASGGFHAAAYT